MPRALGLGAGAELRRKPLAIAVIGGLKGRLNLAGEAKDFPFFSPFASVLLPFNFAF